MASSSIVKPIPTGPQVFINFRGSDVRNSFLCFLEPDMREANINVFIDDDEIIGTDLKNLFVRIQESRIAVVIFSKDYTSSEWCLDELAEIKDCIDQGGLDVFPIFYKIEHSSVKELSGGFGETFRALKRQHKHEKNSKMGGSFRLYSENERHGLVRTKRLLAQIAMKGNPKVILNSEGGFLVPARLLDIAYSDNPEKWTWSAIYDRQHKADIEIATMINTHTSIKITGDFHTRKLTPGTMYEVLFLVKLDDTSLGWNSEVTLTLKLVHLRDKSESERPKSSNLKDYIGDNWVDIKVGDFEAPPNIDDAKIFFSMHQYVDADKKSGLIVKGFAIRPKK